MEEVLHCPITGERFINPVICFDGHTYECAAILTWLERGGKISPITRQELNPDVIVPNLIVKQLVAKLPPEIIDLTTDDSK